MARARVAAATVVFVALLATPADAQTATTKTSTAQATTRRTAMTRTATMQTATAQTATTQTSTAQTATAQTSTAQTATARTASTRCPGAGLRPTRSNVAAVERATICLIDGARAAAALVALHPNAALQRVAAGQSLEMVLGDYFGDDTRSGATPLERIVASRYPAHAAAVSTAQNIGWGTGAEATATEMMAAWMASPPHRAIILTGEFRDVGVGVTPAAPPALAGGQPGATYTVEFGARLG